VLRSPSSSTSTSNVIMRGAQGRGDSQAVRADPNRATAAAREMIGRHRTSAAWSGYGGRAGRIDLRAVAARNTMPGDQPFDSGIRRIQEHERRLAAAADREVADDDHRDARMPGAQDSQPVQDPAAGKR